SRPAWHNAGGGVTGSVSAVRCAVRTKLRGLAAFGLVTAGLLAWAGSAHAQMGGVGSSSGGASSRGGGGGGSGNRLQGQAVSPDLPTTIQGNAGVIGLGRLANTGTGTGPTRPN